MMFLFDIPSWLTGFNFLMGLFAFLLLVAAAFIVVLARGKTDISQLQIDRANAAEGLVKLRDVELDAVEAKLERAEKELEELTAEHRTLAGLIIGELLSHWAQKDQMEAEMADLKRQIRILNLRKDGDG